MDRINTVTWRKSTYSGGNGGGCVEAGNRSHGVLVRDTQDPRWPGSAPVIEFTTDAWRAFMAQMKCQAPAKR